MWSTWVQSCFLSFSIGQSTFLLLFQVFLFVLLADYFKCEQIDGDEANSKYVVPIQSLSNLFTVAVTTYISIYMLCIVDCTRVGSATTFSEYLVILHRRTQQQIFW